MPRGEIGAIEVLSLKTGSAQDSVWSGGYGRYLPSGHLVYIHQGTLLESPMDVSGRPRCHRSSYTRAGGRQFYYPGTGTAGFTFSQLA